MTDNSQFIKKDTPKYLCAQCGKEEVKITFKSQIDKSYRKAVKTQEILIECLACRLKNNFTQILN